MESQPQNPEFRINPENFHPCIRQTLIYFCLALPGISKQKGLLVIQIFLLFTELGK